MADPTNTTPPTPEQQARARWDLLFLNIEHRTEQVRQLKSFEPRRRLLIALTTGAALFAAAVALAALLLRD